MEIFNIRSYNVYIETTQAAEQRRLKMIYTVYSAEGDMTFIMRDDEKSIECVGWYFGEPDADATHDYIGSLKAEIDF